MGNKISEKGRKGIRVLTKLLSGFIIHLFVCGRGGIGIRARLRGVSGNGYGFKSRRPHSQTSCKLLCRIFFTKKQNKVLRPCSANVEMRGVEPLSENPSSKSSPSAFRDLISFCNRPRKD